MPDFIFNALIVGTLIALMAGPLGCFVVWRRMAYFGGAIAHSSLLGVALVLWISGLLSGVGVTIDSFSYRLGRALLDDPWPVVLLMSLLLAYGLLILQRYHLLANDTLLGIVAHGSLAVGLLIVATMTELRIDVMAYLFGDILSIDNNDVIAIFVLSLVVIFVLLRQWRPLLSATINPDIAAIEGINIRRIDFIFVMLLTCAVVLGMRIVGVLLIISILIIPPATARKLASEPVQMAVAASVIGVLDVWLGLALAWYADLPAGPAIVAVSTLLFILSTLTPRSGTK